MTPLLELTLGLGGMRQLSSLRLDPEARILFPRETQTCRVLKLENCSEVAVAWKIKTTSPDCFLVKPRAGVLLASETIEANLTHLPGSVEGARFQVQATPVDGDSFKREDWRDVPRSDIEVAELRSFLVSSAFMQRRGPLEDSSTHQSSDARLVGDCEGGGVREDLGENGHLEVLEQRWEPEYEDCEWEDEATQQRTPWGRTVSEQSRFVVRSSGAQCSQSGGTVWQRPLGTRQAAFRSDHVEIDAGPSAERASKFDEKTLNENVPMHPVVKGVLGLLIAILIVNLYLKPFIVMGYDHFTQS